MNKQLAMTSIGPYASGRNDDFPRLSDSKALSVRWDSRVDLHKDWLAVPALVKSLDETRLVGKAGQ